MRLLGGALLLLSVFLFSALLSRVEKRRQQELEALIDLTTRLRDEIRAFGRPIAEIIAGFENDTLQNLGFYEGVAQGGLPEGIAAIRKNTSLSKEEISSLDRLSGGTLQASAAAAAAAGGGVRGGLSRKLGFQKTGGLLHLRITHLAVFGSKRFDLIHRLRDLLDLLLTVPTENFCNNTQDMPPRTFTKIYFFYYTPNFTACQSLFRKFKISPYIFPQKISLALVFYQN